MFQMSKNSFVQSLLYEWQVKLVCILLACCCYFIITFNSNQDRNVEVPLEVMLPANYESESLVPSSITLNINGSEDVIYLIDPALIKATADFSSVNSEGIAQKTVVLDYDEKAFRKGAITVKTVPSVVRISFKEKKTNE